jgi:hypothetical protein
MGSGFTDWWRAPDMLQTDSNVTFIDECLKWEWLFYTDRFPTKDEVGIICGLTKRILLASGQPITRTLTHRTIAEVVRVLTAS